MAFEARLINRSRIIVSFPHMFLQFLIGKHLVLVWKHFLVSRAQITDLLVVHSANMAMQVRVA
jgi:hypothetical protein